MFGKQIIICAAVKFPDGVMLVGPRHYDKVMLDQYRRYYDGKTYAPSEQYGVCGFLDQLGKFLDRNAAFEVAKREGQLLQADHPGPKLFSEDIYEDYVERFI